MPVNALNRLKWKRKHPSKSILSFPLIAFFFFLTSLLVFFLFFRQQQTPYTLSSHLGAFQHCGEGEKFLWYAPHSGFSNQLSEFKNALLMAAILNRTLILPPILDHHAVALGSCPKFRVLTPNELRMKVWDHAVELLQDGRYFSIGDILDLTAILSSSMIQAIDFRDFVSRLCHLDEDVSCLNDSNVLAAMQSKLNHCGSLLSGMERNADNCVNPVDNDCRTTVWIYKQNGEDGTPDAFQPDEQLRQRKNISYARHRLDVYNNLGPNSKAFLFRVLSFGSLFTAPYRGSESHIDIHQSPADKRIQSLIRNTEFIPFVSEVASAGQVFVRKVIQNPFLCAQLRLLDGQFKNHWRTTFSGLRQKVEGLKPQVTLPMHIFIMTDLPWSNWTGTYLDELAKDTTTFKLHSLKEGDEFVVQTAKKVASAGHGRSLSYTVLKDLGHQPPNKNKVCQNKVLPDILLYLEETVCSCASLGFVGTAGSTISDAIELMRKHESCFRKI